MAAQHARIRLTNRKILASVKSMRSLQGPTHVLETCVFLRGHVMTSALRAEYFRHPSKTLPPPERARTASQNGQRELWCACVVAVRACKPCWLRDSQGGLRVQAARAQQARAERRARARQPAGRAAVGAAVTLSAGGFHRGTSPSVTLVTSEAV